MKKILGICCSLWWGQLDAQNSDTTGVLDSDSLHPLEHLIISDSWIGTTDRKSSIDVTLINPEDWRSNRALSFAQSLTFLPGVNAQNTGVGIARPVIRGMSGQRIVVIERNVKQEGQQWGSDHGLELDMFTVDAVEVLKGAVGLMYGGDAIGGAIRILSPRWSTGKWDSRLQVLGSDNNQERSIGFSHQQKWKGKKGGYVQRVFVAIQTKKSSDYRLPADSFTYLNRTLPLNQGVLNNTAVDEQSALCLWEMIHGYRQLHHLTFQYRWFDQNSGLFPGLVGIPTLASVTSDGNFRNIGMPNAHVNHHKWILQAEGRWGNVSHALELALQINNRIEKSIPHQGPYQILDGGDEALSLDLRDVQGRYTVSHIHWETSQFEVGTSFQKQWNSRGGFEFLIPDFQKNATGTWVIWNRPLIKHSGQWNGGMRWDYASYQMKGLSQWISNNGADMLWQPAIGVNKMFQGISGSVGQSISTSNDWHWKWHVGRTLRVPQASELFVNGVHHGTFRHEQGDQNLTTERGWQWDGMAIKTHQDWVMKCSPFVQYYNSYIYLSPQATFSYLPDGGQLYAYVQHPVWMAGGECSLDKHWLPQLHSDVSVEYIYNYNTATTLPLPFTPPLQLKWGSTYTHQWSSRWEWNCQFQVRYVAAQNRVDRNERSTTDYSLLHGGMSLEYHGKDERWSCLWTLNARNLTNVKYMNNLSNYRVLQLPEQGRWIQIGIEFKWHGQK